HVAARAPPPTTLPHPTPPLFPYTTLFRSHGHARRLLERHRVHVARLDLAADGRDLRLVHRLDAHARERGIAPDRGRDPARCRARDRKSTRLNSSHLVISYAVFCLKTKTLK